MTRYAVTAVCDLFDTYSQIRVICCIVAPNRLAAWSILRAQFGPRPAFILDEV